jgi:hypothetical protein
MILYATVGITMVGGVAVYGESDSALVVLNPMMVLRPDPSLITKSQSYVGGGMSVEPQASVIHSGKVSINDPLNP